MARRFTGKILANWTHYLIDENGCHVALTLQRSRWFSKCFRVIHFCGRRNSSSKMSSTAEWWRKRTSSLMRAYKCRPFDLSRCYQSIHHLLHDKMRNEWMHEKCRPSHASLCRFKLFSFQISLNAFFVLIFFSAVAISFHTKIFFFFELHSRRVDGREIQYATLAAKCIH